MSLLKPIDNGNMYKDYWRWNPIAGCLHGCTYCSIKRIEKRANSDMSTPTFREGYLKDNLGSGRKIFVGSSSDSWGEWVPSNWIYAMLTKCNLHPDNEYLFLTKNPHRYIPFLEGSDLFPPNFMLGTTIETDRTDVLNPYTNIAITPPPAIRAMDMESIRRRFPDVKTMLSLEPLMDFDLDTFVYMVASINPTKVWIGSDSGKNNLPEPEPEKVRTFITQLSHFTEVVEKKNLSRLLGEV